MLPVQDNPPAVLQSGAAIDARLQQLRTPLASHFQRLLLLDRYSRRVPTAWFPRAGVSAPSVMLSTIRAVEKTVIAYLAGGKPNWRVSSYGGYAGQAQQDERRGARDAKFERLARAIWHHIDRQSEQNLLYDPVERAVRQGEVILEYGWLPSAQRVVQDPVMPELAGETAINLSAADLGAVLDADRAAPYRHRFPIYVRVHDRLRVFYELDPFGEPLEVYHAYTCRASQLAEQFPEWEGAGRYQPHDLVQVVQAWVGAYWALSVLGELVIAPKKHLYGARPPFVIERCAPENVADRGTDWGVAEVRAGMPFCLDMLEAYERACRNASLQQAILEHAALGGYVLENADSRRFTTQGDGSLAAGEIVVGPGVVTPLYPNEKLVPAPIQPLPAAMAQVLSEPEQDMAQLSFSLKLLTGEAQGDPSGYGVEQTRQAAMARLLPYRDALSRGFSRLFEKLFGCLALNWAEEWGDSVTLTGQRDGEYFAETVTPLDLTPPPDHVELDLVPAVPQNKLAEDQARIAKTAAGHMDILTAMEEQGIADPQTEWESWLLHKEQMENPLARMGAVQEIIAKRAQQAGHPLPPPVRVGGPGPMPIPGAPGPQGPSMPPPAPGQSPAPAGTPGGAMLGARPPMAPGSRPNMPIPGPGPQGPPAPRQGSRGPAPQQRPGLAPMGIGGAPNPPIPQLGPRRPGGR